MLQHDLGGATKHGGLQRRLETRKRTPSGTASISTCFTRSTAAGRSAGGSNGSTIRKATWSLACDRATPTPSSASPAAFMKRRWGWIIEAERERVYVPWRAALTIGSTTARAALLLIGSARRPAESAVQRQPGQEPALARGGHDRAILVRELLGTLPLVGVPSAADRRWSPALQVACGPAHGTPARGFQPVRLASAAGKMLVPRCGLVSNPRFRAGRYFPCGQMNGPYPRSTSD